MVLRGLPELILILTRIRPEIRVELLEILRHLSILRAVLHWLLIYILLTVTSGWRNGTRIMHRVSGLVVIEVASRRIERSSNMPTFKHRVVLKLICSWGLILLETWVLSISSKSLRMRCRHSCSLRNRMVLSWRKLLVL